jgi:hypothetical protein
MSSISIPIPVQARSRRFVPPDLPTTPQKTCNFTITPSNAFEIRSQKFEIPSRKHEMTSHLYRMYYLLSRMPSSGYRIASLLNRMASRRYRIRSLLSRMTSLLNRTMSHKRKTILFTTKSCFSSDNRQLCLNNFNYKINI